VVLVQVISEGASTMAEDWGLCMDCKWWQIEPAVTIEPHTLGLCIDEDLQPFLVRVSGDSGCNRFVAGEPARARGSSAAPPTAQPTR
jgi:hypothetical protein